MSAHICAPVIDANSANSFGDEEGPCYRAHGLGRIVQANQCSGAELWLRLQLLDAPSQPGGPLRGTSPEVEPASKAEGHAMSSLGSAVRVSAVSRDGEI